MDVSGVDEETKRLARIVGHPIRSRIVELLGQRGPLGWKELSTELGVKTGALYHHLDILEGFVERDASKRYALTKSGRILFSRLSESQGLEAVKRAAVEIRKEGSAARMLTAIFAPRALFSYLNANPNRSVASVAAIASLLVGATLALNISSYGYFLSTGGSWFVVAGCLGVSVGALTALGLLASMVGFQSKADILPLFNGVLWSFLPVFALAAAGALPGISAFFMSSRVVHTLLLVFFQTWSSTLLGSGMSVASGVRIEKTLLVSLLAIYATMVAMLVLGQAV